MAEGKEVGEMGWGGAVKGLAGVVQARGDLRMGKERCHLMRSYCYYVQAT